MTSRSVATADSSPRPSDDVAVASRPPPRLASLDVLRGLALLGLVAMNMGFYASPRGDPTFAHPQGPEALVAVFKEAFLDGRMRGLFSLLFGAGIVLLSRRAGPDAADVHSRRCVALIVLGMAHGYLLLWPGDILFTYGLCGLLLFPFRRLAPRGLVALALVVALIHAGKTWHEIAGNERDHRAGVVVAELAAAGVELDDEQARVLEAHEARSARRDPDAQALAERTAELRLGWWPLLQLRLDDLVESQSQDVYLWKLWDALLAMLLGMALAGSDCLAGRWSSRRYLGLAVAGFGVSLAISLPPTLAWIRSGCDPTRFDLEYRAWLPYDVARLAGAAGYGGLLLSLLASGRSSWLTTRLACVGRLALSLYVAQTLTYVLLFTGVGFGWAGELDAPQQLGVAATMGLATLLIAPAWSARFRHGPLEWWLRWVAEGRRPAFRRRPMAPAVAPSPRAAVTGDAGVQA